VAVAAAHPHLGDDQRAVRGAGDQVQFSHPAAVIAQQDGQALVLEELRRGLFGAGAQLLAIDGR
jgi:hypothetical protein